MLSRKAKESIKTALAMAIAYGIALAMDWDKAMWAGFTVAFVSLSTVGQSINKAALRVVGTLVGVVVSLTLIAWFPQDRWLLIIAMVALVGAAMGMMLVKDPAKFISIVVGKDVVVGTMGEGDGKPHGDQHPEAAGPSETAVAESVDEDEDALV